MVRRFGHRTAYAVRQTEKDLERGFGGHLKGRDDGVGGWSS